MIENGGLSLRPFEQAGGGGPGPIPPRPANPNQQPPFAVRPRTNIHIDYDANGNILNVTGDPYDVSRLMPHLRPRARRQWQRPHLPPIHIPTLPRPNLGPRIDRLRQMLLARQGPQFPLRLAAINPPNQPPNQPPNPPNQPNVLNQPPHPGRRLFFTGLAIGGLAVGVAWAGFDLPSRLQTQPSPQTLSEGQCRRLPAGSIAIGYDYSLDGTSGYHDPNTGTIIELFKPGTFCVGTVRGTYQEVGTTDTEKMNDISANYKSQLQQNGCSGGLGCTYITTIIDK